MAMWHAYADRAALEPGTQVLVTGGHEAVTLRTADRITIELPDNQRLTAVVVDRSGEQLLLAVGEGPLFHLDASADPGGAFSGFKLSDGFSRQGWVVR